MKLPWQKSKDQLLDKEIAKSFKDIIEKLPISGYIRERLTKIIQAKDFDPEAAAITLRRWDITLNTEANVIKIRSLHLWYHSPNK